MLRLPVLLIVFFFYFNQLRPQTLYMSRNVKQAFKKGTRSPTGMPGNAYWQNSARYNITITAQPPARTIQGTEQIVYRNNSPDTLKNLVVKLIANVHKPEAVRLRPVNMDYLNSGIHIDSIAINAKATSLVPMPNAVTWTNLLLNQPLATHDSVKLFIRWHYDVSVQSGREGMVDSTTFFLAYFYPRIAVYDDYNGWDMNEFNDAVEFYNDFNDYTFNVKVPKNYIVWATGTLQNPADVLQAAYVQKLGTSMTADSIIHIAAKEDLAAKQITVQNAVNTWQWKAVNVPDIALGLSDHYVWDGSSVIVDSVTKRRASVQAAFNDTAKDFHYMVSYGRHILTRLSANWPGIPYPYEKTTVFQGYADMEYPMMVNDETFADTSFSKNVAQHEIAHTYMPFYMGINEAQYGFMDEGWTSAFELLINRDDLGGDKVDNSFAQFRVSSWINDPSPGEDLPIIIPGTSLNAGSFENNEYGKAALGYLAVKDLLGDAEFKKCLHAFMDQWHEKHPIPWDFFNTFNEASGKNLNWFWSNWFFSNNYIDLGIQSVNKIATGYAVTIQNIGGMDAPFDVVVNYRDNSRETIHKSPAAWKAVQSRIELSITTKTKVQSIELKGGIFMDADQSNNKWINNKERQ